MDLFQSWGPFNRSEYYNFTGPPIDCGGSKRFRVFIDDNDPNYNWSKTAAENEWCNGSGTYEDPYVIENLYVDAQGIGGCIYIKNSKKFFTIKNCWFENSEWAEYGCGVFLRWLGNGTVEDNIILYTRTGIKTELLVYNVTISNNIMISDHTGKVGGKGIHVGSESNNMTVFDNKIYNHYQGMMVEFSDNIIVDKNILDNRIWKDFTGGHPVSLYDTNYSTLKRNVLAGAFAQGTFKVDQEGCEGNVVEHNAVTTNRSIAFDFNKTIEEINSGKGRPNIATSPSGLIGLSGSNHNYVGYNLSLVDSLPSSASDIPLNMIIFIIGILSIAVAIVAIAFVVRGKKRE
jgi:parallel beta-helix repeat protein